MEQDEEEEPMVLTWKMLKELERQNMERLAAAGCLNQDRNAHILQQSKETEQPGSHLSFLEGTPGKLEVNNVKEGIVHHLNYPLTLHCEGVHCKYNHTKIHSRVKIVQEKMFHKETSHTSLDVQSKQIYDEVAKDDYSNTPIPYKQGLSKCSPNTSTLKDSPPSEPEIEHIYEEIIEQDEDIKGSQYNQQNTHRLQPECSALPHKNVRPKGPPLPTRNKAYKTMLVKYPALKAIKDLRSQQKWAPPVPPRNKTEKKLIDKHPPTEDFLLVEKEHSYGKLRPALSNTNLKSQKEFLSPLPSQAKTSFSKTSSTENFPIKPGLDLFSNMDKKFIQESPPPMAPKHPQNKFLKVLLLQKLDEKDSENEKIEAFQEMPIDVPDSFVPCEKRKPTYPLKMENAPLKERRLKVKFEVTKPHSGLSHKQTDALQQTDKASVDTTDNKQDKLTDAPSMVNDVTSTKNRANKYPHLKNYISQFQKRVSKTQKLKKIFRVNKDKQQTRVIRDSYEMYVQKRKLQDESTRTTETSIGSDVNESELSDNTNNINYNEMLSSLEQLELTLNKDSKAMLNLDKVHLDSKFADAFTTQQNIKILKPSPTPVSMNAVGRLEECLQSIQHCSLPETAELKEILKSDDMKGLMIAHDQACLSAPISADKVDSMAYDEMKVVKINKSKGPLGITVFKDGDAIIIRRLVKGGAAEKCGLIFEGDEVLEINRVETRGKSLEEVCSLLQNKTGTVRLILLPRKGSKNKTVQESVSFVKACFDYDPNDDIYLPCKELGLSFKKGDVLCIVSKADPNWWQAYREGEDEPTLAGLIPSYSFQQLRDATRQLMYKMKGKSKTAENFLCGSLGEGNKNPKAIFKRDCAIDDLNILENTIYVEVTMFYPRIDHKRPVILVGPSDIGKHEIRRKLMEDTERFAAAVPHTTRAKKASEIDGIHYHFISRLQFEEDILKGKFMEYGMFEKEYYGTSLDSIKNVVLSGKICILSVNPKFLEPLYASGLVPYTVLIAPPKLERFRYEMMKKGNFLTTEKLQSIIEESKEIGDKYRKYIEKTITVNDTYQAYFDLFIEISNIENDPHWVPTSWMTNSSAACNTETSV